MRYKKAIFSKTENIIFLDFYMYREFETIHEKIYKKACQKNTFSIYYFCNLIEDEYSIIF